MFLILVEESTKEIVRTAALAVGSLKDTEFDIRFNPDVFSPGINHDDSKGASITKQRQLVKDAADFLLTVQIPTFVSVLSQTSYLVKNQIINLKEVFVIIFYLF